MSSDSTVGFQMPIEINPLDIDHMGHVNNAVYLSWAQKIAIDFWNANATPEMINSRLWVARNHNIEYYKPAFFGDALSGLLTFEKYKGIRVLFHIDIMREHDILARVQSWWCSVDAITHRPAAIAKSFMENLVARP